MEEENFVAYYRVSTRFQQISGLGLEAQRNTVINFVKSRGTITAEFCEIESGRKNDRPELMKALELCKRNGYTLCISKLDRLSRSLTFISSLLDSKVKFIACDFPAANNLTLTIMASIAQYEAAATSTRTREALAIKKLNGFTLGKPENLTAAAREKGLKKRILNAREHPSNKQATELIILYRHQGLTFKDIADKLNKNSYRTRRSCYFYASTVERLYKRAIKT